MDTRWDLEEKEDWESFDHFCDVLCKGMLNFWKNKVKKDIWEWYDVVFLDLAPFIPPLCFKLPIY